MNAHAPALFDTDVPGLEDLYKDMARVGRQAGIGFFGAAHKFVTTLEGFGRMAPALLQHDGDDPAFVARMGGVVCVAAAAVRALSATFDRAEADAEADADADRAANAAWGEHALEGRLAFFRASALHPVCGVCLHALGATRPPVVLDCGHAFHDACARAWSLHDARCAVCRVCGPAVPTPTVPEHGLLPAVAGEGEACPVCLAPEQPGAPLEQLPGCAHAFHTACLRSWCARALTCPVCRAEVHRPHADWIVPLGSVADVAVQWRLQPAAVQSTTRAE
jgi:hypothetical protein